MKKYNTGSSKMVWKAVPYTKHNFQKDLYFFLSPHNCPQMDQVLKSWHELILISNIFFAGEGGGGYKYKRRKTYRNYTSSGAGNKFGHCQTWGEKQKVATCLFLGPTLFTLSPNYFPFHQIIFLSQLNFNRGSSTSVRTLEWEKKTVSQWIFFEIGIW